MKYCGIGGQAVLEGIMMRNRNRYAVAVRKSDGTIETTVEELHPFSEKHRWAAFPFIRGFVSLIESLKTGMKTLMWSALQKQCVSLLERPEFLVWLAAR